MQVCVLGQYYQNSRSNLAPFVFKLQLASLSLLNASCAKNRKFNAGVFQNGAQQWPPGSLFLHLFLTIFLAIPYDIAYVRSNFLSNFALSLLNKVTFL